MDDLRQHLVPAIPRVTDLVVARGEGAYLFDWIPPLVVGDEHVDDAPEIFEAAVAGVGDALRA